MTKLNMEKVRGFESTVVERLTALDGIPSIKGYIATAMSKDIQPVRVKSILDREVNINELLEEEILVLFKAIYNTLKDSEFNPDNFMIESAKKRKVRRDPVEKGKDKEYFATDDERVFHPKFKDEFLTEHRTDKGDPYAPETKRVAIALFGKIGHIEKEYNKDVYSFDSNQFEEVLFELEATTLRSLQNSISKLEQYIDFAISKEKVPSDKGNIATRYSNGNVLKTFLNKEALENMIFPKGEIDAMSDQAHNAQDGVILNLLFDGVSHKRKFIELRSITINHCDFDKLVINIPQLVDEDTGEVLPARQVPISSETARMIQRAMREEKYASLKGNSSRAYKIADSDYILRGLRDNFQIKWENVGQRITRISEIIGYEYLNATNIAYSGQIHYARELIKGGLSVDEACGKIIERYNLSDNDSAHFYLKARIEKANQILSK